MVSNSISKNMKIPNIFQNTIQKTNGIVNEISEKMGWQERPNQSLGALRAVLQTLRDRLPIEEVADFGAQLPTLLRGIFYEGWKPASSPVKMDRDEFIGRIRQRFAFDLDQPVTLLVKTVLSILNKHVSGGEIKDIKAVLPKELQSLFRD